MATAADAELILKLYETSAGRDTAQGAAVSRLRLSIRRPLKSCGSCLATRKSEHNPAGGRHLSYWEMAASLVLRGALDPDLFLDSNAEGILLYAKFHHFHAETEKQSGNPFMGKTAELIAKYPVAQARHEAFLKTFGPK